MSRNMFTPAFGGLPQVFFGRQDEIAFLRAALGNENSPYRVFFITGNRGCGKTTLLEKFSKVASDSGWLNIDVHSAHAAKAVFEALVGGTQRSVDKNASPSAIGISLGGVTTSTTTSFSEASLDRLLVERARSLVLHKGIFITVDEIQKVPEGDAETLCAAVQLALRKGLPVMLALAGLPGAKEKVAAYPGCTFMQRAYDMQIGCMGVDETLDAYRSVFRMMPEFHLDEDALWEAGVFSQGYPYLMQLTGFYLVERLSSDSLPTISVGVDDVRSIEPLALGAYRANVLEPVLAPMPETLSSYLNAMCRVQDDDGRVGTGAVAAFLGKEQSQVSSYRQRLIDRRLIEADGYGYARFLLPHIRDYYDDVATSTLKKDPAQQWNRQATRQES